ncbi:MAG: GNAT family N-acetyltransferase [Candidatus Heimdallarchaeota archaeon]|nr:GNAT family N-acetyltransferase [Candidatus Heimdallarchaeota archaeon]
MIVATRGQGKLKINPEKIFFENATIAHAADWAKIFIKGMNNCQWMSRYFKEQNISELDVSISITQDISKKSDAELFLIAYLSDKPIGIIRFDEYWVPGATKILSHFPLILPKFQRKGIGRLLVKEGFQQAFAKGFTDCWTECWSMDKREISLYQKFYEKIGFRKKSDRLEMNCVLESIKIEDEVVLKGLRTESSQEVTPEIVEAISTSYGNSLDKLHTIEHLDKPEITKHFLEKTKKTVENIGFSIQCIVAKYKKQLCAGLMTATSKNKGMILEIGVIPKYRKLKIAQSLITNYIIQMKNQGIKEIVLGVDHENVPAINLYAKLGFKKTWFGVLMLLEDKEKLGLV